jgi:predicted MFS family arabinose efflux permease
MGYVVGGLLAGVLADRIEFSGTIAVVAVLTMLSGLWVAVDLRSEGRARVGQTA